MYQAHRPDPRDAAVRLVMDFIASAVVFALLSAAILGVLFMLSSVK